MKIGDPQGGWMVYHGKWSETPVIKMDDLGGSEPPFWETSNFGGFGKEKGLKIF